MKYFKSIAVQNFFSYAKEQTLDLSGNGIWNVNAVNGAGKSTITIEALCFAIYGKTRQSVVADIVNRYIGKNCKVSLEFVGDDDELYKIVRYREHDVHKNNVYLFKGDKDVSMKNKSDTDALIEEKIGLPYLAFINSTVFSSETYSNFLSATGADRLAIFENILSLKEVTMFYATTKEIIKEKQEKQELAKIDFTEKNTEVNVLEKNKDNYANSAKEKLLKIKQEKEIAEAEKAELQEKLLEYSLIDIEAEKSKNSKADLKREYLSRVSNIENEIKNLPVLKDVSDEKFLVEKYQNFDFENNKQKELEYNKNIEIYNKIQNELVSLKADEKSLNEKIKFQNLEIEKTEKLLETEKSNMEKIQENICPYCGQVMDQSETEIKRTSIQKNIDELVNKIQELKGNDLTANSHEAEIQELESKLLSINLNNDFVKNSELIQEKYKNALLVLQENSRQKNEIGEKLEKLNNEKNDLLEKANSIELSKYSETELENLKNEIENIKTEIQNRETILSNIKGRISEAFDKNMLDKMNSEIEESKKVMTESKKVLQEIDSDINYYNVLLDCFSNKSQGFKKYFIGEMIELFNEKVNQFLPFFFSDKIEIKFDKDLNDTIKIDDILVSFKSFSCGQKTRAELAVAFALFSVARAFFATDGGMLVIDEILDRGLDKAGIESALAVLEGFANDCKIFIVSHNPIVKENIQNVIEIKRDENGFSYIK